MDQKFVFSVEKKGIFNKVAPLKEISLPECKLGRDWEYSEYCNELVLVRDRFEQNKNSWRNELKLSDFVQNIIGNDYIQPFYQIPDFYTYEIINLI